MLVTLNASMLVRKKLKRNEILLSRTRSSIEFKTRHHHPMPVTPYRSTSLLRRDVAQTHIAGKAYTLPRRQQTSPLRSFAGYSPAGAATPPLAGTRLLTTSADGGVTVWLGDEVGVDEPLSASAARCTCTLRRVVASRPPAADASSSTDVLRGLTATDPPTSFTTFKPTSASIAADVVRARSSISDCGIFYDLPLVTSPRDDMAGRTDYGPQRRDRHVK